MKEIKLIDGRFSVADAESLLTKIITTKVDFHEQKIKTAHDSEENIKHSEKRIKELKDTLRELLSEIKSDPHAKIDIEANIKTIFIRN